MGADIHAHIEYKKHDYWQSFGPMYIPRNYNLFARVAGVRSYITQPEISPRGFPEDACCVTKEYYERLGADAHTPSWLTYHEFWQAVKFSEMDGGHQENHIETQAILAAMSVFQHSKCECRLIFWFDN